MKAVQGHQASSTIGFETACQSVVVMRELLRLTPVASAFSLSTPMETANGDDSDEEDLLGSRLQQSLPGVLCAPKCLLQSEFESY